MAETAAPASRRAILAGAIGAAVASVASALGRPSPASAVATPLYIDQNNPTSLETSIETSAVINNAFVGSHLGSGTGVHGYSGGGNGVYGWTQSSSGAGVSGNASAGSGVNHGVYGQSSSASGRGVTGQALAGTGTTFGVHGYSASSGGTGVHGFAAAASGETRGVTGVAASPSGTGVYGLASSQQNFPSTGVHGQSDSPTGRGGYFVGGNLGVDGHSTAPGGTAGVLGWADGTSAHGVTGVASASSGSTVGVHGRAWSPDGSGVVGFGDALTGANRGVVGHVVSPDGTGVQGYSGASFTAPAPSARTAVYGYATLGTSARGVYGRTTSGQGVRGQATTGTAGYFSTPVVTGLHTGTALHVVGRVKFDRCVGIATIANGASATIAISPGIDLTSTSVVTATLMGSAGAASTVVGRVAMNTTSNTFIVHLNSSNTSGAAVKVGWHVFG